MNKWVYFTLLFLISVGLFYLGILFCYNGINLTLCRDYAIAGELYISACDYLITWGWIYIAVFISLFVALIFLTKKGWKAKK